MNTPTEPVTALATVEPIRGLAAWQAQNRSRRSERRPSRAVYFFHRYILVTGHDWAQRCAERADFIDRLMVPLALLGGSLVFAPMLVYRGIYRIWYGEWAEGDSAKQSKLEP